MQLATSVPLSVVEEGGEVDGVFILTPRDTVDISVTCRSLHYPDAYEWPLVIEAEVSDAVIVP